MLAMGKCVFLSMLHQYFLIDWGKEGPYQSFNGIDRVNYFFFFASLVEHSLFCTSGIVV